MTDDTIPLQIKTIRKNQISLTDKYTKGKFHGYPASEVTINAEEIADQLVEEYPHVMKWARVTSDENGNTVIKLIGSSE